MLVDTLWACAYACLECPFSAAMNSRSGFSLCAHAFCSFCNRRAGLFCCKWTEWSIGIEMYFNVRTTRSVDLVQFENGTRAENADATLFSRLINCSLNYCIVIMCCWLRLIHFSDFSHFANRYNVVAKAMIYYFLPLTIIGVLYALMARRLHLSAREMPGELAGPQSRAQARARRHVARMVVTFVIGE